MSILQYGEMKPIIFNIQISTMEEKKKNGEKKKLRTESEPKHLHFAEGTKLK